MPLKTTQQVFGPGRVKFQIHVAKHLDIGIHILKKSVASARITEVFATLDNFAVKILFPQLRNRIVGRGIVKNKNADGHTLRKQAPDTFRKFQATVIIYNTDIYLHIYPKRKGTIQVPSNID